MTVAVESLARGGEGFVLPGPARDRLARRLERAAARARRSGRPLPASVTVAIDPALDLSAAVAAARRAGEPLTLFEQPDRAGFALAALGEAARVEAAGPARFARAAAAARALGAGALRDDPADDHAAPAASGPVWTGGFAFADDGGEAPEWAGFAPAQLVLPELAIARHAGQARLTLTALAGADDAPGALLERLLARLAELRPVAGLPLIDPSPAVAPRVAGAAPPAHYEAAVERAVERIRAGDLDKVVLAREVRVHARAAFDAAAVYGALREGFPSCLCYLITRREAAFCGASPELLVRREGARAQTVALAGTTRRSADPAVDRHLGEALMSSPKNREEQAIVTRRIEQKLAPVSVWVAAAEEPVLIRVQNVQHLATPIRAQLREPVPLLELAGRLHPTPAVGGEPWERARPLIPALEGLDRGWYAGPVGWCDLAEDGELFVALRCALIRGHVAHLYAGDGIVRDSVPAEELAETEVKLQALLPLLT